MITTIIFDFAGVVSTEQLGGWEKISNRFRLDPGQVRDRYYAHVEEYGRGGEDSTQNFLRKVCGDPGVDLKEFEALYANWWKLNREVAALAEKLKRHYTVVLFSDNFDASTPSMRSDKDLNRLFPKMFFSNELGHTKSEKESFQAVLKELGAKPDECLFIDDKEKPIATARSLGIESLLFVNYATLVSEIKKLGVIV